MNPTRRLLSLWFLVHLTVGATAAADARTEEIPSGSPAAVVDLATTRGVRLMKSAWRYSDARLVEVDFRAAGADGQPTGPVVRTHDVDPKAGEENFDDRGWEEIAPETLAVRRGPGRISFNWYRIRLTIPDRIDGFDPTGSTVVFVTSVDDYAEVWVNGELSRHAGQAGGSVVAGWNGVNRLVVDRGTRPGRSIQIAVFGINGPISDPPTNFIWMRSAQLEFHRGDAGPIALSPREVNVRVERLDPGMDAVAGPNPKLYKVAEGFTFTEGPVWVPETDRLLFSDPNENVIYSYSGEKGLSVYRRMSGYAGPDIADYAQPGSNGLALDPDGRVVIDEHGNRRVVRLERDGRVTVLADRYQGRRLNSPNDLIYASDGTLYFTDPPFGLPRVFEDPRKELAFSGVYAVRDGAIRLLTSEMTGPNGIALSPDERYLYVGNWDVENRVVMRYAISPHGTLRDGRRYFDATGQPGEDAIDGLKVDVAGNVYVSGPGGLWVVSPDGRPLGRIIAPRHVHNMAWGDPDGRSLYLCARDSLYRMPLRIAGFRSTGAPSGRNGRP